MGGMRRMGPGALNPRRDSKRRLGPLLLGVIRCCGVARRAKFLLCINWFIRHEI